MTIIQHKRGPSTNWTSSDPVLAVSEIGYETDTGKFKIGDGASAWSTLPYFSTSVGGSGTVTSITAGTGLSGGTITTSGTIALSHLGIESLTDPNADRILFWDDSASSAQWLTLGTNLSISGTTINATDTNTTYTAGTGLTLSGTEFSVTANTYQPLDSDLTAIAALSADGLLRKTSGTWGMDTATYLTSYTETDTLASVTGRGATTNTAISITNATSSTTTTTGALKVTGGVGIQENLNVGGNVIVTGDITINGTTTTLNSTIVTVDDPIFTLGGDTAPGSDDNKDRGIAFRWHNGATAKIGFFGYDDSAQQFTFIPDATITSEVVSGTAGTITANLNGNATSADTATTATTATDATSADTVKTVATATNASFYPVFVDANNGTATSESLYTDAGLVFNPSSNNLSIGGDLAINGGDLTSSSTTFNMLTGTVTTLNLATGATTAINIGSGSGGTLTLASPNITLSGFSGSTGLVKSTAGVLSIDTSTYLTSSSTLTAGNLSGTIPTGVLGNSSLYVGTTSVALNRSSANLALTGITSLTGGTGTTALTLSSADTSGAASGAVSLVSGEATSSTAGTVKVDSGNNGTPGSGGANVGIGTTNASSITIGRAGITTTIAGTLSATVSNATDATSADTVKTVSTATNASFYPTFVDANNGTATSEAVYTDAGLVYNPSSNTLTVGGNLVVGGVSIQVEGATADSFETLLTVTDPTADRTITFPDATGTVALTSDISGFVTSVTGTSPVSSSGGTTPAISLASGYGDTQNPYGSKTTNYVLAGPAAGPSAAPSFRALVSADIPDLSGTYVAVSGGTAPTATNANNINISTTTGNTSDTTMYPVLVAANTTGNQAPHTDVSGIVYNASTDSLSLTGDLTVTGGDVLLGGTGTATTIKTLATTGTSSGSLTIATGDTTTSGASGNITIDVGNGATSDGTISIGDTYASAITIGRAGVTTTIAGTLSATVSNATNATTATNATNINISTTDGNTSDTTMYPVFVAANTTGNQLPHTDVSGFTYNASTNTISTGVGSFTGDVAVNGGDLTTTASTFNLVNTNATTVNIGGAATTMAIGSSTSTVTFGNTVSADEVWATNNGNGENFKVGDDTWIGDINVANTLRIKGQQNSNNAYVVFGDSDAKSLGRAGTGRLTYDSALVPATYYKIVATDNTSLINTSGGVAATYSAFGTNGINLPIGSYEIDMVLLVSATTASNSSTLIVTPGSPSSAAVPSSTQLYYTYSDSTTVMTNAAATSGVLRTGTTTFPSLNTITIATGTTRYLRALVKGIVNIATAGNFTIRLAFAPGAGGSVTGTIYAGSYLKLTPLGAEAVTDIGTWA